MWCNEIKSNKSKNNLVFSSMGVKWHWKQLTWRGATIILYISNIYLTEIYNTKDIFRLIVRLDYIIDIYMTNVGWRFGFFLSLTDVYSVITDLFDHCCFNILELGNCHKIPPHSKHSPPNHIPSPMCPHIW